MWKLERQTSRELSSNSVFPLDSVITSFGSLFWFYSPQLRCLGFVSRLSSILFPAAAGGLKPSAWSCPLIFSYSVPANCMMAACSMTSQGCGNSNFLKHLLLSFFYCHWLLTHCPLVVFGRLTELHTPLTALWPRRGLCPRPDTHYPVLFHWASTSGLRLYCQKNRLEA